MAGCSGESESDQRFAAGVAVTRMRGGLDVRDRLDDAVPVCRGRSPIGLCDGDASAAVQTGEDRPQKFFAGRRVGWRGQNSIGTKTSIRNSDALAASMTSSNCST